MVDTAGVHEVFALRYGARQSSKAMEYLAYHRYGQPDEPCSVAYYVWLVRDGDRTILADCGYNKERAARHGRLQQNTLSNDVLDVLARMGVAALDVDHVVLSHMHLDHVGNASRFPNATFSLAREEFEFWTGPRTARALFAETVDPEEVAVVRSLFQEGRLQLIEESAELFPGIRVTRIGGHTPGQMITEIDTASGRVVLASDAVHFYEELELDRPFWFFVDLDGMYRAYDTLRELDRQPGTAVVPGHDQAVMERYTVVAEDCVDLTRSVERL
jgi:glyoxylase-like metal-dependent hydrolase (beta-lactamase superfamily II)